MPARRLLLAAVAGLLSAALAAEDPPGRWIGIDPGGGGAFMAAGGGPSGLIVVCGDLSGGYLSEDRGKSWTVLGYYRGVDATHCSGVGFDPLDPDIFYLGSAHGIYRTRDRGRSFERVLADGYVTDIAFAPTQPSIGYAGRMSRWNAPDGQVYKTTDRGLSWRQVSANLPPGVAVRRILLHPTDPNIVYMMSSERFKGAFGVFRSGDGGVRWTRLAPDLEQASDLAIDPFRPATLYLLAKEGVYKSTDNGETWTRVFDRQGNLFTHSKRRNLVRLINQSGVWESEDAGANWSRVATNTSWDPGFKPTFNYSWSITGRTIVNGDLSDPDRYYWITGQWVYGSFDGGRKFKPLYTYEDPPGSGCWRTTGINNTEMYDLAVSEADPQQIYLGFWDMGLWRSDNGGRSWRTGNSPTLTGPWKGRGGHSKTVLADPERPGVVWAGMGDKPGPGEEAKLAIVRSEKAGDPESWVAVGPRGDIWGLSLDRHSPTHSRTLFVTVSGVVYRSQDDGRTWTEVFSSDTCRSTAVDHFDGRLVWAGCFGGVWRSLEGGEPGTWSKVGTPEMHSGPEQAQRRQQGVHVQADPARPGWVYVACYGEGKGLYRSRDRGQSWEKLLTNAWMRGVAVNPANPDIIYATSSQNTCCGAPPEGSLGVVRSTDGGATWTQVNEGLPWPFAWPIALDPADPSVVYIGSPGTGFYRRRFEDPGEANQTTKPENGQKTLLRTTATAVLRPAASFATVYQVNGPPNAARGGIPWPYGGTPQQRVVRL